MTPNNPGRRTISTNCTLGHPDNFTVFPLKIAQITSPCKQRGRIYPLLTKDATPA